MPYSSLIQLPEPFPESIGSYVVVGSDPVSGEQIVHLAAREAIPEGATVLMPGDGPWTWAAFVTLHPTLAAYVRPQTWLGEESIAEGLDASLFPLLTQPDPGPLET